MGRIDEGIDPGTDPDEMREPAYQEGHRAAERRVGSDGNPHPPGSDEHRRWQAGHASVTAPDIVADTVGDFA